MPCGKQLWITRRGARGRSTRTRPVVSNDGLGRRHRPGRADHASVATDLGRTRRATVDTPTETGLGSSQAKLCVRVSGTAVGSEWRSGRRGSLRRRPSTDQTLSGPKGRARSMRREKQAASAKSVVARLDIQRAAPLVLPTAIKPRDRRRQHERAGWPAGDPRGPVPQGRKGSRRRAGTCPADGRCRRSARRCR